MTVLLKVGELAKRSGVTVRTLHHYDDIGLLRPSARSDSGYRLYDQDDIARLHGIQALRALDLPLEEIGRLLGADGRTSLPGIVERQLQALQEQIDQASVLRDRLQLVQAKFATGDQPDVDDWLATLQLMTTSSRWFSTNEIVEIFRDWRQIEPQWERLVGEIRAAMDAGVPPDDPQLHPLAQRWMALMHSWMQGDFSRIERWGAMFHAEPTMHGRVGMDLELVSYIEPTVQKRLALLLRHVSEEEMRRLGSVPEADWRALAAEVQRLVDAGVQPEDTAARPAVERWIALHERLTRGDPVLRRKMQQAYDTEPLLRRGGIVPEAARDFLVRGRQALEAGGGA